MYNIVNLLDLMTGGRRARAIAVIQNKNDEARKKMARQVRETTHSGNTVI